MYEMEWFTVVGDWVSSARMVRIMYDVALVSQSIEN